MLQSIIGFELRYRLRQPGFYVTMALIALAAGLLATAQAVGPGARSLALINQPYARPPFRLWFARDVVQLLV